MGPYECGNLRPRTANEHVFMALFGGHCGAIDRVLSGISEQFCPVGAAMGAR